MNRIDSARRSPARAGLRGPRAAAAMAGLCAVAMVGSTPAWGGYDIGWFTVNSGGTTQSSGGPYVLTGTIGQPGAGLAGGGEFSLVGGFWAAADAAYTVGVGEDEGEGLPLTVELGAVAPNPVTDRAVVLFELPRSGLVDLRLFDVAGRVRRTLVHEALPPGRYQRPWDGTDDAGRRVAAGIYFVRLDAQGAHRGRKVIVLR